MSISIKDICLYGIYRNQIELIAGINGCERLVSFISIMEVEDFPDNCQGNELIVLTTFSFCKGNEELMYHIFKKLIDKNISALIVKINRFIKDIPERLIELANHTNTPLFIVKENIFFKNIISDVDSLIINKDFNIISQLNDQHETLYRAILYGENLNSFIKRMGLILNHDCCCISSNGEIISEYSKSKSSFNRKIDFKEIINNEINIESIIENDIKFIHSVNNSFYIYPCIAKKKILGFFAIKSELELSDMEFILAQQMSSFLSIKLLEGQLEMEVKNRMTEAITDELLFNYNPDELMVKDRLKLLGLIPQDNFYFLVVSPNKLVKEDYALDELNSQENIILSIIRKYSYDSIVKISSNNFFAIITFSNNNKLMNKNAYKVMLDDLEENKEISSRFKIACSQKQTDYRQLPNTYSSTRKTLKYGLAFFPNRTVYYYGDFLDIYLISNTIYSEEYLEIKNTIINPLRDHDTKYNTHLFDTLRACIDNDTLENAAKDIYIHISTLRYRLEKIYEITGISYFNNKGRYLLTNSYYLSKLENI